MGPRCSKPYRALTKNTIKQTKASASSPTKSKKTSKSKECKAGAVGVWGFAGLRALRFSMIPGVPLVSVLVEWLQTRCKKAGVMLYLWCKDSGAFGFRWLVCDFCGSQAGVWKPVSSREAFVPSFVCLQLLWGRMGRLGLQGCMAQVH